MSDPARAPQVPPRAPDCRFCRGVGAELPNEILGEHELGYLIKGQPPAPRRLFGRRWLPRLRFGWDLPVYVIVPHEHWGSVHDLPDDWQAAVNHFVSLLGFENYNVSYNQGHAAGQRVPDHPHAKIQERSSVLERGLPSATFGFEFCKRQLNRRWWHRLFW